MIKAIRNVAELAEPNEDHAFVSNIFRSYRFSEASEINKKTLKKFNYIWKNKRCICSPCCAYAQLTPPPLNKLHFRMSNCEAK